MAEAGHCETCGRALQESVAGLCPNCVLRTAIEHGAGQTVASQLPKLHYFGDYELLEEIARGGMGVVYRARQVSLDRIVAVKMMRPGLLATEAEIRRFHAEAKTAASLQHPNIVAIHEVGEIDGLHYFSMDFVDGPSLADLVRERALSPAEAAGHVKTLAETVHYAHGRGILHRDLKPSNVLVDSTGRPRITDFGLARPLSADSTATVQGTVVGTPAYMPPEQASGDHDRLAPASDVYSLGAILYQLLTGLPPFRGTTQLETMRMVLEERPATPCQLNAAIPRALEAICLRCLEKNPAARYASAGDLAGDLDRFLGGKKPVWHDRQSLRRRWMRVTAAAFVVIGLVLAYAVLRTGPPRPRPVLSAETYTIEHIPPPYGATPVPASDPRKLMSKVSRTPSQTPPPTAPSITSESGTGGQQVFTFRYPLRPSFPKAAAIQIRFHGTRAKVQCECAITIEPDSRRVSLQSDPERGPELRISGSAGAAALLENAVCTIDLSNLSVDARSGTPLEVRIPVTFKRGFDGPSPIDSALLDQSGRSFFKVTDKR